MPRKRTLKALTKELIDTPFFPLLFLSEAVKIAALQRELTFDLIVMLLLSAVSVALWVMSDAIDVDIDTEDITG